MTHLSITGLYRVKGDAAAAAVCTEPRLQLRPCRSSSSFGHLVYRKLVYASGSEEGSRGGGRCVATCAWLRPPALKSKYSGQSSAIARRGRGRDPGRVATGCSLTGPLTASRSSGGGTMECGVAGAYPPRAHAVHGAHTALSPTERSPAKAGLHVNFSDKGEVKERREKFLTAKYGSHQMALIRKRLAVEMWLYDELQKLYESPATTESGAASASDTSQEVEVDIDELLDMDSEEQRWRHLTVLLADAKKPQKDVHRFIKDLLEKAKTL
ncbi:unnamed protein product [Leptosia nina]|uniref:Protein phosphatase 1 regulatory subunit 14B n=1 Tax=Leptosia nina TaxID=320188 RepID=A0AAV1JLG4_9NEOP